MLQIISGGIRNLFICKTGIHYFIFYIDFYKIKNFLDEYNSNTCQHVYPEEINDFIITAAQTDMTLFLFSSLPI